MLTKLFAWVLIPMLVSIIANDLWSLCDRAARRIVISAAKVWSRDREQAKDLEEEWQAYITDRPGQVLKLLTALNLMMGAILRAAGRRFQRIPRRLGPIELTISFKFLEWPAYILADRVGSLVPGVLAVGMVASFSAALILAASELPLMWAYILLGIAGAGLVGIFLAGVVVGILDLLTRGPIVIFRYGKAKSVRSVGAENLFPDSTRHLDQGRAWPAEASEVRLASGVRLVRPYVDALPQVDPDVPQTGLRVAHT